MIFTCVGYCFATGSCGVPVSKNGAKTFFELALKSGDTKANLIYAFFLLKNQPFKTDFKLAL